MLNRPLNELPSWCIRLSALMLTLSCTVVTTAQSAASAPPQHDTSWRARYEHARAELVAERFFEAERALFALQQSAQSSEERLLASELLGIARAQLRRRSADNQPSLRTKDELTVLYTTAVFYGLGSGAWLALQLRPRSFGAAIVPFAVLTPAAVGIVAWSDDYRPLRHGIPHAIAAGMYLGFGEGLWIVGYQNAYASRHEGASRWGAERVSTALWASATVGALAGGLIGAWRRPTTGRVSFTASTAIWGGLLSAFATTAIEPDRDERNQRAYLVGAIGYNVGLLAGLLFGPSAAPSVARVRFTDLGGLFGALALGGGYALLSNARSSRGALGAAAIGGVLGLGITWWATSGMPADRSHDKLHPAIGTNSLRPLVAPLPGGLVVGLSGAL